MIHAPVLDVNLHIYIMYITVCITHLFCVLFSNFGVHVLLNIFVVPFHRVYTGVNRTVDDHSTMQLLLIQSTCISHVHSVNVLIH